MACSKAFVVSSDSSLVSKLAKVLDSFGASQICVFRSFSEAESNLQLLSPSLVICHVNGEQDCVAASQLGQAAAKQKCGDALLAITEEFLPDVSLRLLRCGFTDCLARPLDIDRLRFWVSARGTTRGRLRDGLAVNDEPLSLRLPRGGTFSCRSDKLKRAINVAERVARRDAPVLIRGETGTGKTLLARMIHQLSPRKDKSFVDVHCGTLAENLVESELFGHMKGAFTGADSDRVGRFASAGQGTLFLDDVDTLPLGTQAKLLRAFDQRLFEPLGSNKSRELQARMVVATNAPLEELVESRQFRRDLYYRMNVVQIALPPLRECPEDVRPLVEMHVRRIATESGQKVPELDQRLIATLENYSWPGNVRELINVVEQLMVFVDGRTLTTSDLPDSFLSETGIPVQQPSAASVAAGGQPLKAARESGEMGKLLSTLRTAANNRTVAAKMLNVSRVTLYKKMHKYGLIGGALAADGFGP